LYDRLPTYVHRADVVYVEAVLKFGGMAVGWDVEPIKNWEPLIDLSEGWCTVDADNFPGGLFGAVPNHQAFKVVLEEIEEGITRRGGFATPNRDTGPYPWNRALGAGGKLPQALDRIPKESAFPIHWNDKERLNDPKVQAQLRANPKVYAIHYFNHSWKNLEDVKVR
jgi:mannosyltransferase OCH1-like enzyme